MCVCVYGAKAVLCKSMSYSHTLILWYNIHQTPNTNNRFYAIAQMKIENDDEYKRNNINNHNID